MTPPRHHDPALDRLFAGYWDGTLTPAEWDVLNARLEGDSEARHWFREVCVHAAVAGEATAQDPPADAPPARPEPQKGRRRLTRRAALGFGAGLAAGVVGGGLVARWWAQPTPSPPDAGQGVRVAWTRGR